MQVDGKLILLYFTLRTVSNHTCGLVWDPHPPPHHELYVVCAETSPWVPDHLCAGTQYIIIIIHKHHWRTQIHGSHIFGLTNFPHFSSILGKIPPFSMILGKIPWLENVSPFSSPCGNHENHTLSDRHLKRDFSWQCNIRRFSKWGVPHCHRHMQWIKDCCKVLHVNVCLRHFRCLCLVYGY